MRGRFPVVLITGTPGVGKTRISTEVAKRLAINHIDINALAKEHECYCGTDDERFCNILDEERVIEEVRKILKSSNGAIIDYHGADMFPTKWISKVFVITADNTILYDRLTARNYNEKKISENIECEIFQVLLDEARDWFGDEIVVKLENNVEEDFERNVEKVIEFMDSCQDIRADFDADSDTDSNNSSNDSDS